MKYPNQLSQNTLFSALRPIFTIDKRRFTVLVALILAVIQQRSVVLNNLKTVISLPGSQKARYDRLLRFVQFTIPEAMYLNFALGVLGTNEVQFILDRTNWKLGQKDVNILLLSAVWKGCSLPLMWRLLPHGGNSNQALRQELVSAFLKQCPKVKVTALLADREFIGQDWFKFLDAHGIEPCIRLRCTDKMDGMPVHCFSRKMYVGELRVWHRPVTVYGVKLRVLALKISDGSILYLAYRGRAKRNLRTYALRWQCETLHAALKSRGFNLEGTGLTEPARVSTLLTVVCMAFIWCVHAGLQLIDEGKKSTRRAIRPRKHGYANKSIFRLGLDELRDLLSHPTVQNWSRLGRLIPRFEG